MKKQLAIVASKSAEQPGSVNRFNQYRGRMIAPQECASELGVSEFTVHRWIREGKIKAVKLSTRCTRIEGDSLSDHMTANTFVPGEKEAQPEQLRNHSRKKGGKNSATEIAGQD